MKSIYRLVYIAVLMCIFGSLSAQQTGILQGKVVNSSEGYGMPGVNIIIKETVLGTASGLHGEFTISNIPIGKYEVLISCLGFQTQEKIMEIKPGETTSMEIFLEEGSINLSSIRVEASKPFSAASSMSAREFDMEIRPARTAQDLLSLAPGLFIAQHAGGGKAEQIFLRGFDADHGTDVGIYVDGMPVNMVTHGHGQGYADLHFVIPETVDAMSVQKGSYFAEFGNFATAGSISLKTVDHPGKNLLKLEGGMFNTAKLTTVLKIPTKSIHQSAYIAGQYATTDGPFESPQDFQRMNIFGKFHTHLSQQSELGVSLGAFSSAWNASGQFPERAVKEGLITRWGAIDDMEGGNTSRYNASVDYAFGEGSDREFQLQGYASTYNFKLFSNFTFWLNDSVDGDMIEQLDNRSIMGINAHYALRNVLGNTLSYTKVGGGIRSDNIELALWHSPYRIRKEIRTSDEIAERNLFMWLEQDFIFNEHWKLQLGLRGDYFTFNVNDNLDSPEAPQTDLPHASGYSQQSLLSPKLNLVYSPVEHVDLYLNSGTGFHSNDARDVIIAQRTREIGNSLRKRGYSEEEILNTLVAMNFNPAYGNIKTLPRVIGAELGTRLHLGENVVLSFAGWYLYMEEELVFVGDEGTTEISGETRRLGLDIEGRFQFNSWLWADLDVNISDGRYLDLPEGENYIPLAPRVFSQGGFSMLHPSGFEASLRFRHIDDRPANEDNSVVALGFFIMNLSAAYRFGEFRIFANLENLLNSEWNEAQFDTESRLYNEPAPVSELNFTPGNPFNVQAGIAWEF